MGARIYYDAKCPFCARYTALLRLRESVGDVEMIDARGMPDPPEGIDSGMVLDLDGRRFIGAEAMHRLALLSTGSGWFNRLNAWLFSVPLLAAVVYPILRAGRAVTLFALGRDRIVGNPAEQQALFAIFSHAWGLLAYLHLLYYIYYEGSTHVFWTTWVVGGLGAYLTVRPRSPRTFVLLCGFLVWDAWSQMPVYSNHTILRNFALLAILLAAGYTWLRGRNWSCFMEAFAPVGRCLLVVMYVFGVFHKINADFLNPDVSCAVAVWQSMPQPLPMLDAEWFRWATIYGTLVGETAILFGLMFKPTRQASIMLGMAFHSLISLSGYGFYPSFSTLAVALHLLFLSPQAAARITSSRQWLAMEGKLAGARGVTVAALWFVGLWLLTKSGNSSSLGLMWMPWAIWTIALVYRYAKDRPGERTLGPAMLSRSWAINAVSVFFFLNCFSPYLGLKTAQSMNMFANLAVEGGFNNHLILRGKPGPFEYLDDVVKPISGGSKVLAYAANEGLYLTYYDLLNLLERDRSAVVSYELNGVVHQRQSYATLKSEINRLLHPRWFRNWFLFRPIDMREPKSCSLSQ